jgi:hypothetical protein
MRKAYRVIALLIAVEVLVQAAAVAWGIFGLGAWIDEGNTFNKTMMECRDCPWNFPEERGFMIHGLNGFLVIPVLGLALLVVSFFTRDRMLVRWAAITFGLILVQSQLLPALGREYPVFGALHGLNAILLFGAAVITWRKAKAPVASDETSPQMSGAA